MRSWGIRAVLAAAVALTALGVSAAAMGVPTASTTKLRVTPAKGAPHTVFTLAFTAPRATGLGPGTATRLQSTLSVTASGPRHASDCVAQISRSPTAARNGEMIHVRLAPGSGEWCRGTYSGSVNETGTPVCRAGVACPQFIMVTPVGSFSFTVRH
jgi:hypothetical protein